MRFVCALMFLVLFVKYHSQGDFLFLLPSSNYEFYLFQSLALLVTFVFFRQVLNLKYIAAIGAYFSRFSYTLYVIHFPLLILSFSIFHDLVHEGLIDWYAPALFTCLITVLISDYLSRHLENKRMYANWIRMLLNGRPIVNHLGK